MMASSTARGQITDTGPSQKVPRSPPPSGLAFSFKHTWSRRNIARPYITEHETSSSCSEVRENPMLFQNITGQHTSYHEEAGRTEPGESCKRLTEPVIDPRA